MTGPELVSALDKVRGILVTAATITIMPANELAALNDQYVKLTRAISPQLTERKLPPIGYDNLNLWRGKWSIGEYKSYDSRRELVKNMFAPYSVLSVKVADDYEPTGWPRVDQGIETSRKQLAAANTEAEFQAVGITCRDALLWLARTVYMAEKHPPVDDVVPSNADTKRMLQAYVATELAGNANEDARRLMRAAVDFANAVQHKQTASRREATLCIEATAAVINLIAVLAGKK